MTSIETNSSRSCSDFYAIGQKLTAQKKSCSSMKWKTSLKLWTLQSLLKSKNRCSINSQNLLRAHTFK